MATKKELDVLSGLYQSIEGKGGVKDNIISINKHLGELNGTLAETIRAGSVTREIADNAQDTAEKADKKADSTNKNLNRWLIGLSIVLLGTVLGLGIPTLLG